MKKKIHLAVCANFPYFGGDPFVIQQLTKGLSKKGFQITLIGPCQKAAARVVRRFSWIHQFTLFNYGGWKSSVLKKLSKNPPDAVLNSGFMGYPAAIALHFQKPLFWRVMSQTPRPIIQKLGLFADGIIADSNFVKSPFVKAGFRKVEMIHEGCDTIYFKPHQKEQAQFRKEFKLGSNDVAVGIIANLARQKRHEILIKAWKLLSNDSSAKCFIIGGSFGVKGMELNRLKLEKLIKKFGLQEKIVFIGFRQDRRRVLNGLDILVFPFLNEGFGMSLVEAMACERPVIVNHSGSFPEIVRHGQEGIMVPAENPKVLAKELDELIENRRKRSAMGQKGRLRVIEKFSLEKQIQSYTKYFKKNLKQI